MYDSKHPQFHSLGHAIGAHHRGLLMVRLRGAYFDLRFARRCLRLETDRMLTKLASGASIEAEMTGHTPLVRAILCLAERPIIGQRDELGDEIPIR